MSLWKPSELTALNDTGHGPLSVDTLVVLRGALEVAQASGGAFDPTVEPLVRASGGFGGERRSLGVAERRALLSLVGFHRVTLDPAAARVHLGGGTRLDFGGIAKGYAADRALAELRRFSAKSGWVDLGRSSLGAFGQALSVDIRDPDQPDGPPVASFVLRDAFVGTSAADQKGPHILDPRTGEPAGRSVVCATVVARTGMEADALSTALYVLGADAGLDFVERRGAFGFLVEHSPDGRRVVRTSPGFTERLKLVLAPGIGRN
jgi:thiamine biosynthesis lipoprotein